MSLDLDEGVRQLAVAEESAIDLGKVGSRYFHTLAGLGYFSRVARQRAEVRRSVPNKIVGAAVAMWRSVTRGGSLDVTVDAGRGPETLRTPAILITNNLLEPNSWRRPRLDAGVFEINVVRGDIPFPLLRGGLAALTGSWRESADILTWAAPRITLSFRRPRVFLSLDGEVKRPRAPLHFEIVPKALTVLKPPAPAQAEEAVKLDGTQSGTAR
jgi:diacylglycerol kinase family enzyme